MEGKTPKAGLRAWTAVHTDIHHLCIIKDDNTLVPLTVFPWSRELQLRSQFARAHRALQRSSRVLRPCVIMGATFSAQILPRKVELDAALGELPRLVFRSSRGLPFQSKSLEEEALFKSQKSELVFFCGQELQADHILPQCIVALGSQHLRLERPLQRLELKLMWQESVKTL
ncbi:hypothetical protein L207DRAFT_588964 [Hyaloscypha variabilis F]|uniref:Uncharacterized protein n=1 Tax=Hyaloscypha variabilis (strain UAMH 11265 / GT02V1 / F) TaxID=1149755 RepID=A0A2J6R786_HYAVF|nr:hypothetical protein L207DRAFT_588964 [Hyaloscypha variabilis F]